jgi:hypothetical protein
VVHREYLRNDLISENTFFYSPFKKMEQRPAELP